MRAIALVLAAALLVLPLGGCQDYRGLDELSIVAGFTVDKSAESPDMLDVCFEIVDTAVGKDEKGKKTTTIQTSGITINDAIAAANRLAPKDLYFGNADLLVIGHRLAEEDGLNAVLEPLIRDFSIRDTMLVAISRENTAQEILAGAEESDRIKSYTITQSLDWRKQNADSIRSFQIFEIFEFMKTQADCLALPALKLREEGEKKQPELDGMAVFQKDRMKGYLSGDDVRYYLFMTRTLSDGTFTYHYDDDEKKTITLSIKNSVAEHSCKQVDGRFHLSTKLKVETSIGELSPLIGRIDREKLADIERQSAAHLSREITRTIRDMQEGPATDIFGYPYYMYRREPDLWDSVREDWPAHFRDAEITIEPAVTIKTTGMIFDY